MTNVLDLAARRPAVRYTIRIAHHWDGTLEFFVEDVANDQRARDAIAWAMQRGAEVFSEPVDSQNEP